MYQAVQGDVGQGTLESMTASVILTVTTTWSAALTSGKSAQWVSSHTQPVPLLKIPFPAPYHTSVSSECLNVCWFAVSLFPLIHVLLFPLNIQDNLLQSKESCVSTGYCQAKNFAFYKSRTRQDQQKQFTVCFLLLNAFELYVFVSYTKKKSVKSQFRVLQKEILTHSNSNLRSVDAVGSNPKPGCPSIDRN